RTCRTAHRPSQDHSGAKHTEDASGISHRDLDVTLLEDATAREGAIAFEKAAPHSIECSPRALQRCERSVENPAIEFPQLFLRRAAEILRQRAPCLGIPCTQLVVRVLELLREPRVHQIEAVPELQQRAHNRSFGDPSALLLLSGEPKRAISPVLPEIDT